MKYFYFLFFVLSSFYCSSNEYEKSNYYFSIFDGDNFDKSTPVYYNENHLWHPIVMEHHPYCFCKGLTEKNDNFDKLIPIIYHENHLWYPLMESHHPYCPCNYVK